MSVIITNENDIRLIQMKKSLDKVFSKDSEVSWFIDAVLIHNAYHGGLGIFTNDSEMSNKRFRKLSLMFHPDKYSQNTIDTKELTEQQIKDLETFLKKWLNNSKDSAMFSNGFNATSIKDFAHNTFIKMKALKETHDEFMIQIGTNKPKFENNTPQANKAHDAKKPTTSVNAEVMKKLKAVKNSIFKTISYAKQFFTNPKADLKEFNKHIAQTNLQLEDLTSFVKKHNLSAPQNKSSKYWLAFINASEKIVNNLQIFATKAYEFKQSSKEHAKQSMKESLKMAESLYDTYVAPLAQKISKQLDTLAIKNAAKAFTFMANRYKGARSGEEKYKKTNINKYKD